MSPTGSTSSQFVSSPYGFTHCTRMCVCVTRQQMSMDSNIELFLDCFGVYFKFYPCIILLQYHSLLQGKEGQHIHTIRQLAQTRHLTLTPHVVPHPVHLNAFPTNDGHKRTIHGI